jgi:hypothetical protein
VEGERGRVWLDGEARGNDVPGGLGGLGQGLAVRWSGATLEVELGVRGEPLVAVTGVLGGIRSDWQPEGEGVILGPR